MLESDDQIDTETCRTTPHILENGTECKSFTPLTDSAPCRQVPDGRVTGALTTWMAGFAHFAYRHRYPQRGSRAGISCLPEGALPRRDRVFRYLRALVCFRGLALAGLRSPRSPCPAFTFCLCLFAAIRRERAAFVVAVLAFGTAADIAFVAAQRDLLTFRRRSPFRNSFHVVFQLGLLVSQLPAKRDGSLSPRDLLGRGV